MGKNAAISTVSAIGSARGWALKERPVREGRRPLWDWFEEGHVLELSGAAPGKLSLAARLMARAQGAGEVVVYVAAEQTPLLFPPDLEALGIDLEALLLVRCPGVAGARPGVSFGSRADPRAPTRSAGEQVLRATEILLRSGAFGLVVLELPEVPGGELAWQARLLGLVRAHGSRLLLLTTTSSERPSLGSLVSLRVEARREERGGLVQLEAAILKSKLGQNIAASPDVRSLPAGAA